MRHMIDTWWDFADSSGQWGSDLALYQIACGFCKSKGNFALAHQEKMLRANGDKTLYFETYKCGNCGGYKLVFWTNNGEGGRGGIHDYIEIPRALQGSRQPPEYWPANVKRFWVQAHTSMTTETWDAAVAMARSTLHAAIFDKGGEGKTLYDKINDLVKKDLLPPLMATWATEIRLLGKVAAHPEEEEKEITNLDAKDIVKFMDSLLEYVYDFPREIEAYRQRREKEA